MDTPDNDNVEQTKPKAPAPTISAPPGRDLEQRLKLNPEVTSLFDFNFDDVVIDWP